MSGSSKSVKKTIEEAQSKDFEELDLQDRGMSTLVDFPQLSKSTFFKMLFFYLFIHVL